MQDEVKIRYTCRGHAIDTDKTKFTGCGYDLGLFFMLENMVCDGELHRVSCPKCGAVHTYRRTPE
jgi:hypothetical protein